MAKKTTSSTDSNIAQFLPAPAYVDGIVFAVAACPDIPMPEQWMPWVLSVSQKPSVNAKQANQLADFLMEKLRFTLDKMRCDQPLLPDDCVWHSDEKQRAALKNWLHGLLTGHQQLEGSWQQAWSETQEHALDMQGLSLRLARCLKLFSTLADPNAAIERSPEDKRVVLIEGLPKLAASLPAMLKEYTEISGEIAQILPNQFEVYSANKD